MDPQIVVRDLCKTYRVPERETGLAASIKSLFKRIYRDVEAVREISFQVEPGRAGRLYRSQRRRQDDHAQDAVRPALSDRRRSPGAGARALGAQAGLSAADQHGAGQQEPDDVGHSRPWIPFTCWARSMP